MRTLALTLLLLPASSFAAERSISITTDAKDEGRLTTLAAQANAATCDNFALPPICTVAEIVAKHQHGDPKAPRPDPTPVIYKDGWDYFVRALARPALDAAFMRAKSAEEAAALKGYQKLTPEQRAALAAKP
jgi:hypothetical protein